MAKVRRRREYLAAGLKKANQTPAGLTRHLGVKGPRVYEVLGGRRGIQPAEYERVAEFLGWPLERLVEEEKAYSGRVPALSAGREDDDEAELFRDALEVQRIMKALRADRRRR